MRVLVTGFDWHGDLVPYVIDGLRQLDATTAVVSTSTNAPLRSRAGRIRTLGRVPVVGRSLAGRWQTRLSGQAISEVNDRFAATVSRFQPDVVLSLLCWGDPLRPGTIAGAAGARRIGWLMDDPFGFERSGLQNLLQAYDDLYSVDDGWSDNVELMTGRRPIWLPCGAAPEFHHPVEPSAREADLEHHIVFVGVSGLNPGGALRQSLIDALKGLPVAIFGDAGWARAGGFAGSCYRGGPVTTARANAIYASAGIVLNIHHPQFRRGTSLRTFAICGAGAFQLVDWREGLDRWLMPGRELEVFRNPAQLRSLAEKYLTNVSARRQIAAAGHARVLAEHTYAHRLSVMFQRIAQAPCA